MRPADQLDVKAELDDILKDISALHKRVGAVRNAVLSDATIQELTAKLDRYETAFAAVSSAMAPSQPEASARKRAADPPKRPAGKSRRVQPASDDEAEEFIVDAILEDRKAGRGREYLIAWQGHPSTANTWEPAKNLPPGLVRAYHSAA